MIVSFQSQNNSSDGKVCGQFFVGALWLALMGGYKCFLRRLRRFGILLRLHLIEDGNLVPQYILLPLAGLSKPSALDVGDNFAQAIHPMLHVDELLILHSKLRILSRHTSMCC